jgi:large repetitive protein
MNVKNQAPSYRLSGNKFCITRAAQQLAALIPPRGILFTLLALLAAFTAPSALDAQTASPLTFAGYQTPLGLSGLAEPYGLATDAAGDLFIANAGPGSVIELPANGNPPVAVAQGLSGPTGVAVDAAGDLFIVDNSSNTVVEIPAGGGSQSTIGSGLNIPIGVAVDSAGDVFIADQGNNRVVEVPAGGGSQTTIGTGFNHPCGVAVDRAGDVFIADSGNNRVVEIPSGGSQTTLGAAGLLNPVGVTVDAVGNVYIADSDNNRVVELLAGSGSQLTLVQSISRPYGVAVEGAGNVYISAYGSNSVVLANRFGANLGSANVCPVGTTSPTPCSQTATLTYDASSAVTIGSVNVLTQGATGLDFTLNSTTCKGDLSAGSSCAVTVKFRPKAPGQRLGTVQLIYSSGEIAARSASTPVFGEGQGPAIAFGPGAQSTVGSGLTAPLAVAVDASGDLFVADESETGKGSVMKIAAGSGAQTTIASVGDPTALAVDGVGNVFVADTYNREIVEIPAAGGNPNILASGIFPLGLAIDAIDDLFVSESGGTLVEIPAGSGGNPITIATAGNPTGMAVNAAGDVFFSEVSSGQVFEIPVGNGAPIVVASGFSTPQGLAIDAAGDLFVADENGGQVAETSSGGLTEASIGSGLNSPIGVAVDAMGDVFIADTENNRVVKVNRSTPPAFSFTPGSSQSVTLENIGNQLLYAFVPGLTIGSSDFYFEEEPSGATSSNCTSDFSLTPGGGCSLSILFAPTASGAVTSTAVLSDNALNGDPAKQTINLSGTLFKPSLSVNGGPFTYNGLAQSASCAATGVDGVSVTGSCTFTYNGSSTEPINVGSYKVMASFTSANPSYTNVNSNGTMTISKAPLTITANGAVYLQGGTFPTLTVNYSGFVDGQTTSVLTGTLKITTTATSGSVQGIYPIVPSGLTAKNYAITYVDGTLAVLSSTGLYGIYHIQNVNSGLYLGVQGASTSNGADIVQWTPDGSYDQYWTLIQLKNGAYQIFDVNSALFVGVLGASTNAGASVVQWQADTSTDQQWQFTPVGSNWLITNVKSGLQMAIEGNSTSAGGQVIQWPANGTASQLFTLIPVQ